MRITRIFVIVTLLAAKLAAQIDIIPRPQSCTAHNGSFMLTAATRLYFDPGVADLAGYSERFAAMLRHATGFPVPVEVLPADTTLGDALWLIGRGAGVEQGTEGYTLEVTPRGCVIRANAAPGFFYALQTLRQLLPREIDAAEPVDGLSWTIPCVSILDRPRFSWRGMHFDVCRHFFSVEFVKKYIDMLAIYKLNTFHLHLTDDQGWRIEISKYPRLTEVGAWRSDGSGGRYGGFYTREEIREIVAYAAERAITIVPEIEMPGHSSAALTSYPWLGCTGGPYRVQTGWGIFDDVFCAGKDTTFHFLEDVLSEVMELFPGEYIHVGGDECPKTRWANCPFCQARITAEGLANENELQTWFMRRIGTFLNAHGRRLIGWDEILEGGAVPHATAMAWRGIEYGVAAVRSGHTTVMSPFSHCYFDYYQGSSSSEPKAIGGFLPLETVYSFEPVPDFLTAEEKARILGAQANLWTEYILDPRYVEYMLFPRLCALSEVDWSAASLRDFADFSRRMVTHYERLQSANINVRIPPAPYFAGAGDSTGIDFWEADPASGTQAGAGARIGSDALLWSMNEEARYSGAAIALPAPVDLRLRIPYYSLTFSYKTNLALDTLLIGFTDAAGKNFYYPLPSRSITATNKWSTFSQALSGFKPDPGFDSSRVVRFGFWTRSSRSGASFYFADIYLGVPASWPAAHAPIVFFDGGNFNPLFRIKGFSNAAGSGLLQGGGWRPNTNALRWLPPADRSSSAIRWRFNETIDLSLVMPADTLKLSLKAPAGCDSLQLAFTDARQKTSSCWLAAGEGLFDGQWHALALPLRQFVADSGFSAAAVDLFSFFNRNSLAKCEILLTDIWVGSPSPSTISGIAENRRPVEEYRLEQNYPNPFNPLTTIAYCLPQRGHVQLTVHNVLGQCVATLVDRVQEGGSYQLYWDGGVLATGTYFYRLQVNDFVRTRKMVLVK
jgi:hexosaminidase